MDLKRQKRKEIDLTQRESVWLQKALFALRRAEIAHDKLRDAKGEPVAEPYAVGQGDTIYRISELEDALEAKIEGMMASIRRMREEVTEMR